MSPPTPPGFPKDQAHHTSPRRTPQLSEQLLTLLHAPIPMETAEEGESAQGPWKKKAFPRLSITPQPLAALSLFMPFPGSL